MENSDLDRVPGADHRAETKPNAFWRTLLQVGPAAALSLLVILPEILEEIVGSFGDTLPPNLYGALVAITAGVTLVAGILAKLMAMPAVQAWFEKYLPLFGSTKK